MIVSVVMITYKHEEYLADAINGVLMQECDFGVELIIADDCSPDRTKEIVEGFKSHKNYHWIKYTRHAKNKGMMANFMWALRFAKGKYIALCEGDDYWSDPLKLQKQVCFLEENPKFGLVYTNYQILKGGELLLNKTNLKDYSSLNDYFKDDLKFIYTGSWVIKNVFSDLQWIESDILLPGDVQLACYMLHLGFSIKCIDQVTGVYRFIEESASHSKLIDKNLSFVAVKYFLVEKYKSSLNNEMHNSILDRIIDKNFHYFQKFSLKFGMRIKLFIKVKERKGVSRAMNFLFFNNSL